ncbi:MAG TPA: hypothetical protein VGV69_00260 [Solirubrobacterales bacterium]|nr:hypothetical protein [Solirubrobacterales bacterium]
MDVDRLTQGEKIAGVAAIVLFISMFFAWFGFDTPGNELGISIDLSFNAWESFDFIDLVLFVTVLVAVGSALVKAADAAIDFPLNAVVAVLGGLCTLLVLYRIVDPPGGADREWAVFLGLILSALVAYGGYRAMQEEGSSFAEVGDRFSGGGRGGPGAGSSQPPSQSPPPPPPPPAGQGGPPPAQ